MCVRVWRGAPLVGRPVGADWHPATSRGRPALVVAPAPPPFLGASPPGASGIGGVGSLPRQLAAGGLLSCLRVARAALAGSSWSSPSCAGAP
eukprot:11067735-Alexandrium_andersonii.AAC.1